MILTDPDVLRVLLDKHGFHFSKALGQNFLIEAWVPEDIAAASGADQDTSVLEVGPGVGCLTAELSRRAGKVVSVELDKRLLPLLEESLAEYPNVEIVPGDIMRTDLRALVAERFEGKKPIVCANLPYNITTPVLTKFIESGLFESITVMIQREVAERLCAEAGSAAYGAISVFIEYYTKAEMLFPVGSECFMPRPKVESSVVRLKKRAEPEWPARDEAFLFRVVRAAFEQRRKTLSNALSGKIADKEIIREAMSSCGFDERVRGETLNTADFVKLADRILSLKKT